MKQTRSKNLISLIILTLFMVGASLSRVPFQEEFPIIKVIIFASELFSAIVLFWFIPKRKNIISQISILLIFLGFRFIFGFISAYFHFDETVIDSMQEARFGLMLIVLPLAYSFLKDATENDLKLYVVAYLLVVFFLDIVVFLIFFKNGILLLGLRTGHRFVCSILPPLVAISALVIRIWQRNSKAIGFSYVPVLFMIFHSILITTSRIEMLLSVGLLVFLTCVRLPRLRWVFYILFFVFIIFICDQILFDSDQMIAGRNFPLAFNLAQEGLPFGYGFAVDKISQNSMGLPSNFYFSDFGMILYLLRYGILGIFVIIGLIYFWFKFFYKSLLIEGMSLFAVTILIFLIFIPILDYGSLNGSFILALMYFTISLPNRYCKANLQSMNNLNYI